MPPPVKTQPSRMTRASIKKSRHDAPHRTLVIGVEGVGKTTFGAGFPSPVFLAPEDGISFVDVPAYPEPKTAQDIDDAIADLTDTPSEFKTLVIDTIDWMEEFLAARLCKRNKWNNIETPGFGKGQVALVGEWRLLLSKLDALRAARGIEVLMLSHAVVKPFLNPSGPDYSRYELALTKGASALVKQWSDVVLFATFEDILTNQKGEDVTGAAFSRTKVKGVSTGNRVLHTQRCTAWDAKSRIALPQTIALDAESYLRARAKGLDIDIPAARAECHELATQAGLADDAHTRIDAIEEPHELLMALNSLRVRAQQ